MYNKVNDNPITGSGELCHEISGLNPSSSYAVVVTSANGATGDPEILDQQLSSVQGQFVAYFVDTGEPGEGVCEGVWCGCVGVGVGVWCGCGVGYRLIVLPPPFSSMYCRPIGL